MLRSFSKIKILLLLICVGQINLSCNVRNYFTESPPVILWAWERNENLRFIDTGKFGVAYLSQTIFLTGEDVILRPRRQPLKVKPETYLIAVTRIETNPISLKLNDKQLTQTADLIIKSSERKELAGIQIDFDVKVSERNFYRRLLSIVRNKLPDDKKLSITSLASFCTEDKWFKDLPVDEAIPMLFDLGIDKNKIIADLQKGKDFSEKLCQKSYGFAVYEPYDQIDFDKNRKRYFFNSRAWTISDLKEIDSWEESYSETEDEK